ncbi:MAG: hypothetical protein IH800_05430, partial [Myxococcales bacterium]|nr:hypothetical protein [Myxococcales bacterium]
NCGEPLSGDEALGSRRDLFLESDDPEASPEWRPFIENLGYRIAERINWAVVPNATSIVSSALLGERLRWRR